MSFDDKLFGEMNVSGTLGVLKNKIMFFIKGGERERKIGREFGREFVNISFNFDDK